MAYAGSAVHCGLSIFSSVTRLGDIMPEEWRIGIGYDVHHVVAGRRLILGGFEISSGFGLVGHEDGDVVLHALIDALFGAAGLPDIGERFPEDLQQLSHALGLPVDQLHEYGITTSPDQENTARSIGNLNGKEMLSQALDEVQAQGWVVNNVDATIQAKRPQLSPHKLSIKKSLADLLHIDWGRVSVKANPNVGVSAVEEGRVIACEVGLSLRGPGPDRPATD